MDRKPQAKSAAHAAARKAKPVDGGSTIVVRIRGMRTTPRKIEHTMLLMNLSRKFHCAILPNDAIGRGMIEQSKDFITYGPANAKAVEELFSKRGHTADGKALTDDYLKASKSGFNSIKELSAAVLAGTTRLSRVKAVKCVFRLSPPRKGFGSIKGVFPDGALGVRNEKEMEALIASMI